MGGQAGDWPINRSARRLDLGLTAGNLVFNLYPILLRRYNRCRIEQLLRHRVEGIRAYP
jgi:hypothetical protein